MPAPRSSVGPGPLLMAVLIALTLVTSGAGAQAQDEPVADVCALLTPEEVGETLGAEVAVEPDPVGCTWSTTKSGGFAAATAGWTDVTLPDQQAASPGGANLTVGGRTASYSPGFFLNDLLIEVDAGVLWLLVTGFDGDVEAALTGLGELAVSRSGSLPPPPD